MIAEMTDVAKEFKAHRADFKQAMEKGQYHRVGVQTYEDSIKLTGMGYTVWVASGHDWQTIGYGRTIEGIDAALDTIQWLLDNRIMGAVFVSECNCQK